MINRTLALGIAAVLVTAVGVALSFFELIIIGVIAAIAAVVLAVKRQPTREAPSRG